MDNKNPLPAVGKPPASEPELRGFGNPADEEAGRLIMTYEEMLARKAAQDAGVTEIPPVTRSPEPVTENQGVTEIALEAVTKNPPAGPVTKIPCEPEATVTENQARRGRPKLPVTKNAAERMKAYRARKASR